MKNRSWRLAFGLVIAFVCVYGVLGASASAAPITPASLNMAWLSPGNATWFGNTGVWSNQNISIVGTPTLSNASTTTPIPLMYLAYSLNGGAPVNITSAPHVTLTQEGVYTWDGVGILNAVSYESTTTVLRIDKSRPTSWSNAVPVYDGTATVTMTATDTLSGAGFVVYSVDNVTDFASSVGPYLGSFPVTATINVTDPGAHSMSWFSIDRAGNHEAWHSASFRVNALGYVPQLGKPSTSVKKTRKVTFKGSVTPATSNRALKLTVQRKNGKVWKPFAVYSATVSRYMGSYSVMKYVSKAGTYRVMTAEGTGASVWSKNFVLK